MATCAGCGHDTYRYTVVDGNDLCHSCHRTYIYHRKPVFPFTTNHIAGPDHPITVNSMYELRKIEQAHGVQLAAFHMDEKHMSAEEFTSRVPHGPSRSRIPMRGWEGMEGRR